MYNQQIQAGYAGWLSQYHWDYVITVTFRKRFTDWYKAHLFVWQALHDKCHAKRAFLAAEKHPLLGNQVHVHGLISGDDYNWAPNLMLPWDTWDVLFHRFGRSLVQPARDDAAANRYVAKYILKAPGDYGVYGHPYFWTIDNCGIMSRR